tara:strand:- start:79 stop:603 length:525 start_codon:yes stop_codon:yes gene_type:complete
MNSRSSDRKILVGIFGKPFGIKGFLYLRYFINNTEKLNDFDKLYLSDNELIKIEETLYHKGKNIVKLRGVKDRNHAESYRDKEIYVYTKQLPSLSAGEYYWYQLETLKVINQQNEILGQVHHVLETGANDVLVVRPKVDSIDNKDRLIPFTKNEVINKVDLKENSVYVKWPKDY